MHLLYAVTIQPLELACKFLYLYLVEVTGTYGLSLLCLSLLISVGLLPLRRLTYSLRDRELRVRAVLAPQLAAIKAESRGAERQARTAALYRRYAYHPLMALRSSTGILLQVPFLCAAYAMLSSFEPIRGQGAFGLIPDLGAPDGLLGGLNVLPFLMTLVNILAVLTTRGFTRQEKLQGGLIALLFLILLYPAPSALLIYWTGNNLFMLMDNVIRLLARFLPARVPKMAATYKAKLSPLAGGEVKPTITAFLRTVIPVCAAVFAIPSVMALRSYSQLFIRGWVQTAAILVLLIAAAWTLRRVIRRTGRLRLPLGVLIAGLSLWPFYIMRDILAQSDAFLPDRVLFFYDVITLALGVCLAAGIDWRGCFTFCRNALAAGIDLPLFAFSSLTLALTFGCLSPYALYLSSPEHFGVPFSQVLVSLLPYMILLLSLCFLVRQALPLALRPWLVCVWLFLALLVFLNSTIFTGSYGSLDGFILEHPVNLDSPLSAATDLLVCLLVFLIIFAMYYFRAVRPMLFCLQGACVAMLLSTAVVAGLDLEADRRMSMGSVTLERGGAFSFSKTHPNVVVLFLDMFTGGHVEDIFAEYVDLPPSFAGFTWYPDTVTVGEKTSLSTPSLLGGPAFAPDRLNQRPELTLMDKFIESMTVLPKAFAAHGYITTYLNAPYYSRNTYNDALLKRLSRDTPPRVLRLLPESELSRRWGLNIGLDILSWKKNDAYPPEFMFLLSLFKALPHTLKDSLYNRGLWLPWVLPESNKYQYKRTLYNSAVLGLLPELAGLEADHPTLTILHSLLPHGSWHLPKDSLIPVADPYPATEGQYTKVDGVIPEHLYTETHTLRMLAAFFDWLRAEGLYDNTMILLVSDHCIADSRMLNAALGVDEQGTVHGWLKYNAYPGRPHGLLMWKRFNDNAPFSQSPDLMSSMDAPALACEAIGGCPGVERPDGGPERVRVHYYGIDARQIEVPGKKIYDPWKKAVVRGTMFRLENWSPDE